MLGPVPVPGDLVQLVGSKRQHHPHPEAEAPDPESTCVARSALPKHLRALARKDEVDQQKAPAGPRHAATPLSSPLSPGAGLPWVKTEFRPHDAKGGGGNRKPPRPPPRQDDTICAPLSRCVLQNRLGRIAAYGT